MGPVVTQPHHAYITCAAAGLKKGDHVHMAGMPEPPGVVTRVDSKQEWCDVRWRDGFTPGTWSKRIFRPELLLLDDTALTLQAHAMGDHPGGYRDWNCSLCRAAVMTPNRAKSQCQVCGRFLRDDDPYGDFHTSHYHPTEYAEQMQRYMDANRPPLIPLTALTFSGNTMRRRKTQHNEVKK